MTSRLSETLNFSLSRKREGVPKMNEVGKSLARAWLYNPLPMHGKTAEESLSPASLRVSGTLAVTKGPLPILWEVKLQGCGNNCSMLPIAQIPNFIPSPRFHSLPHQADSKLGLSIGAHLIVGCSPWEGVSPLLFPSQTIAWLFFLILF